MSDLRLLASARSAGKSISYEGRSWVIEEATEASFNELDICIFSAGGSQSNAFAQAAVASGCIVVDNSSAFRNDPEVPLVVPEINPEAVEAHKGIIATVSYTHLTLPTKA